MPETQPKVGHLRDVSTNTVKKTGRPLVTETQPKVGHLRDVSESDAKKSGRPVPEPMTDRGYGQAKDDPQPPEPRRIDDKVGPAEGAGY
jgi:hypothetical protein